MEDMAEPTLTATAGRARLLSPLLAQWDTSLQMLHERLDGLTDHEYRWQPAAGAADLVEDQGVLRVEVNPAGVVRTIAWTLGHLADMCWARADDTDGAKRRAVDPLGGRGRDRRAGVAGRLLIVSAGHGPRPTVR